jgi:hypothetical protein
MSAEAVEARRALSPDWRRSTEPQIAIFVNGLAMTGPSDIPGHAVKREDIEKAFRRGNSSSGKQSEV